jgi:hypothetical protein
MHQYPRLLALLGCSIVAYGCYAAGLFAPLHPLLDDHGYLTLFLVGMLSSCGFTAPLAVAALVELGPSVPLWSGAIVAGIGAVTTDLCLLLLLRSPLFETEVHRLKHTRPLQAVRALLHHRRISPHVRRSILWLLASITIASPLPDELGICLISSSNSLHTRTFTLLAFGLNTAGILTILAGSRAIGVA